MDPSWVYSLIITNSQRKSPNLSKSLPAEDGSVPPEIVRDQDTKRNPTVEWSHQLQWWFAQFALWCSQAELEFIRLFGWGTRNPEIQKWMVELKVNSMGFPLKATNVSIFQATHWKQASVSDVFLKWWKRHCLFQGRRDFSIKSFIPCTWSVPSDTPAVDFIHNGSQRLQRLRGRSLQVPAIRKIGYPLVNLQKAMENGHL